jgi:carbamoyltransferase
MNILGISDTHNAAACLVNDGVVVAARQEERITRVKNEHRFPVGAIDWLLESTRTRVDDVDVVALSTFYVGRPYTRDELMQWFEALDTVRTRIHRLVRRTPVMTLQKKRRRAERMAALEGLGFDRDRVAVVEHHTCHAAAAYHGSSWKNEPVLILTLDGEGDGICGSVRTARDGRMEAPIATIASADSIGALYTLTTHLLGMVPLEHEYKVMGLAPYAAADKAERSCEALRDLFEFSGPHGLSWRRSNGWPDLFFARPQLEAAMRFQRFDWIAAGLQRFLEEHVSEWVRRAVAVTGIRRVALSGGVFMNVKLNKVISELPEVVDVFVFPSCGDETNSMGAAWYARERIRAGNGLPSAIPAVGPVYWGPEPKVERDGPELSRLRAGGFAITEPTDIEDAVAELLASGEVVARAKGREEFGARALGNRSILADPTRPAVVKVINDMIKNRDFWMPFAPAMLAEESDKYIKNPKRLFAPYMIMAFDSTERVDEYPAGVHPYDLTARPQMVTEEHNPGFHHLLRCFQQRTGRAVILNTSFNLHGFPIVSSGEDAIDVLENSGLQHLALGQFLISKPRR